MTEPTPTSHREKTSSALDHYRQNQWVGMLPVQDPCSTETPPVLIRLRSDIEGQKYGEKKTKKHTDEREIREER